MGPRALHRRHAGGARHGPRRDPALAPTAPCAPLAASTRPRRRRCRASMRVVTGEDARAWSAPFIVSVRQPMEHWCIATGPGCATPASRSPSSWRRTATGRKTRSRLIDVRYEPLDAVVDPEATLNSRRAGAAREGRQQPRQRKVVPLRRAGGGVRGGRRTRSRPRCAIRATPARPSSAWV